MFIECCTKLNITVSNENLIDNETSGEYELMTEKIRGRPVYLRRFPQQMTLFYHENEWKMGRDPNSNDDEDLIIKVLGEAYSCPESEDNEKSYHIPTESSILEVDIKCIGTRFV